MWHTARLHMKICESTCIKVYFLALYMVTKVLTRAVLHSKFRDANFNFVTLGMEIRSAFSITSLLSFITKN